jgi:hypothetical protein
MNDRRLRSLSAVAVACVAAALSACGGNPAGMDAQGVVVHGVVQGTQTLRAAFLHAASVHASAAAGAATVTVSVAENPAISTTVGSDGSFTLRGLPTGGFTLVFTSGGAELGRLTLAEVNANQEITLTVQVSDSGVVLLEEQRNGIGHGDVEIEGTVAQILALSPTGDSRFLINGRTVVARPGETAVREGNRSRNIEDVTLDRRVHVKGVWLPAEASVQPVLAHEIVLQSDETDDGGTTPPPASTQCPTGANVQVEGLISAKSGSVLTVNQQGKGDFACEVSGSTKIRKGNTTYTLAQLQPGWRVHVSGTGFGLSGGACRVAADEVKVQ